MKRWELEPKTLCLFRETYCLIQSTATPYIKYTTASINLYPVSRPKVFINLGFPPFIYIIYKSLYKSFSASFGALTTYCQCWKWWKIHKCTALYNENNFRTKSLLHYLGFYVVCVRCTSFLKFFNLHRYEKLFGINLNLKFLKSGFIYGYYLNKKV